MLFRFALLVTLTALTIVCGWAQSVGGYVLDPSGGLIRGAKIELEDQGRGVKRTVDSNANGYYSISSLPAATYVLRVKAAGMNPLEIHELKLDVGSSRRVDLNMPLGGVYSVMVVQADAIGLRLESAEGGRTIEQSRIESLPLNRRDFLQLALLSSGVATPVENSELSSRGSFSMHASGAREEFNQFLIDGVDNNDPYNNRYLLQPTVETIQEFRVATNNYSADQGRSAGAQVSVMTKSGTNQFSGELNEYFRNRVLDARNYFEGPQTAAYGRNQYGASLGGPIKSDKLFFYANFGGLNERKGFSRLGSVPSLAERNGQIATAIVDPFTRKPFPGNMIPASRIDPLARNILALFPQPNQAALGANLLSQPLLRDSSAQGSGRLDWQASNKDTFSLRYSYGLDDLLEPYTEDSRSLPGFGDLVHNTAHNAMAQHTRVFSPNLISTLRLGFTRSYRSVLTESNQVDVGKLWGVNWLNVKPRDFGYPAVNVAGYSAAGDANVLPLYRHTNTYQISEGVDWLLGKHHLRMGLDLREWQANAILDYYSRGSLSFSGAISGTGISDLLLGFPSFALQAQSDNPQTLRATYTAPYLQDDWKLSRRLTLSLGLRYEYASPPKDPYDRMAALNPATGKISRVGTNGLPRTVMQPDRNNWAPRIGLAWNLDNKTVIRSGYGIYYDSGMFVVNSSQYFNPPYFQVRVFFPTATSLISLTNPFTGGITPPPSPNSVSPDARTSYLQHWSFAIERSLGALTTFNVSYVGSKGTHLVRSRDLNQPRPGPGDVASRRPNPNFSGIFWIETAGNSNYNSLQMNLDRRMGHGLSVLAAYTYAKSIDGASAFLGTGSDKNFPQDSQNIHAERAASSFDIRHRMTAAPVYQLPWFKHTEFRAIFTAQTGQPFTPILRFDNSNSGNAGGVFGSDRPNVAKVQRVDPHTAAQWFDTSAFTIAPQYKFGNAGRNVLRAQGLLQVDCSLSKKFQLSERVSLDAAAEAFNLFNRTQFDVPELFADQPSTFGRVLSSKAPRQIQLALRLRWGR